MLTVGTLAYLACLPLGWLSYRGYQRKDAEAAAAAMGAAQPSEVPPAPRPPNLGGEDERPARLN